MSVTKLVRLDTVLIMESELVPKLKVPTIVSAARALRLLVVRKEPILVLIAKLLPEPVDKLRETRLD